MNTTIQRKPKWLLPLLFASLFLMYGCPQPCTSITATGNTFFADSGNGPATNTIPVVYFSEAWMNAGDVVYLKFPCQLPNQTNHTTTSSDPGTPASSLSIVRIADDTLKVALAQSVTSNASAPLIFTIDFIGFDAVFKVKVLPTNSNLIPVTKGDANANGRVDMLDLAGLAQAIFQQNYGMAPHTPDPSFDPTATSNWIEPWPETWQWTGLVNEVINFAHADCNGDGWVDMEDFEILKSELRPIDIDLFLRDAVNDIEFVLERHPTKPVIAYPADGIEPAHVEIPYEVRMGNVGATNVLGIVHRRPITENACYRVRSIKPGMDNAFLADKDSVLGHHVMWQGNTANLENLCASDAETTISVIDIGMFGTNRLHDLPANSRIMDCIVDIDDIFRNVTNGTCPVVQYDFDGMIFGRNQNGGFNISPARCTNRSYVLVPGDTCLSDYLQIVIKDNLEDFGRQKGPFPPAAWQSPYITLSDINGPVSAVRQGSDYDVSIKAMNLSCNPIGPVSVALYMVEPPAGANPPIWGANTALVGTCTIASIPKRTYASCQITLPGSFTLNAVNGIDLVAVISAPNDSNPISDWTTQNSTVQDVVTNSNNVAALTLPVQ